jgi:hypothetical protein
VKNSWTDTGYADRGGHRAQSGAEHRAQAEAGVEAGHDRPPEPALHVGALDVHGHVPRAVAHARQHQTGTGQRDRRERRTAAQKDQAEHHRPGTEHDRPRRSQPLDQRSGERDGGDRRHRQAEQEQAEAGRGQVQIVTHGGGPGEPARVREPVGGERDTDRDLGGLQPGAVEKRRHPLNLTVKAPSGDLVQRGDE